MWTFKQQEFKPEDVALNGNRFILGNGYMGYRGTLEEYSKNEQVSCMLNGLYDRFEDKWREPVNAPNGLFTQVIYAGEKLSAITSKVIAHEQELDIRNGIHRRKTVLEKNGILFTIKSEKFISHDRIHLIGMKFSVSASAKVKVTVQTGIDGDVWDINGPHLRQMTFTKDKKMISARALTHEQQKEVFANEFIELQDVTDNIISDADSIMHQLDIELEPLRDFAFRKYVSVYTSLDSNTPGSAARQECLDAATSGYDTMRQQHCAVCEKYWNASDVVIDGDTEAQFALRYSLYQLMILATRHSSDVSIPARGLSGQVYKGAVFWDTEMFMLPFFTLTDPAVARNLILFRYKTLDGARRKAIEYGFKGAFFAWESQETGDDACSHFNVPDVFTGRPMRTYFRDKQVHISADIAFALKQYLQQTGDMSVLWTGAAEVMIECARFFYSYAYFKADKNRFEILDVTGPDEYHERVNNNAYTNKMVLETLKIAIEAVAIVKQENRNFYDELNARLGFEPEIADWANMKEKLYVPSPAKETLLIEQFDRYYTLEDISMATLKSRKLDPHEYLGGGNGLAASTRILKQADVILMLNVFKHEFDTEVIRRNWEYYEPRTEHGSSLSACAYAMTAASIGKADWAYKFFMKTATVDLTGESKQFIGSLYIGGTHPAANGGAWMSVVFGFAGLSVAPDAVILKHSLPEKWHHIKFSVTLKEQRFDLAVYKDKVEITAAATNTKAQQFKCGQTTESVLPGKKVIINK